MRRFVRRVLCWLTGAALVALAVVAGTVALRSPSNDRDWNEDQARMPEVSVDGRRVTVRNVRNFRYAAEDRWTAAWDTRQYDLDSLTAAWFVVEPFGGAVRGPAHTFVTFAFGDTSFVGISVEIRKERGESFSALKGALRSYELMYVIGDERDLVQLRTNQRHDSVYLYPVRAPRETLQALFLAMARRADALRRRPEFYNTLTSNCTTNLVSHVNALAPGRIPPTYATLLPGYADAVAARLDLLDTDLPLEQARARYRINARALTAAGRDDFSRRIRAVE